VGGGVWHTLRGACKLDYDPGVSLLDPRLLSSNPSGWPGGNQERKSERYLQGDERTPLVPRSLVAVMRPTRFNDLTVQQVNGFREYDFP
jgi:hypothetical protein